ncbi:hypothetical protein R3P38DRAFT_2805278 [Favolaschia claudopus]|uniref:Uncharacterized protein n=1 Tax=Favolaschia claudopus TaxID=2862362 RepID=A0AAV9ZN70_9AGAR
MARQAVASGVGCSAASARRSDGPTSSEAVRSGSLSLKEWICSLPPVPESSPEVQQNEGYWLLYVGRKIISVTRVWGLRPKEVYLRVASWDEMPSSEPDTTEAQLQRPLIRVSQLPSPRKRKPRPKRAPKQCPLRFPRLPIYSGGGDITPPGSMVIDLSATESCHASSPAPVDFDLTPYAGAVWSDDLPDAVKQARDAARRVPSAVYVLPSVDFRDFGHEFGHPKAESDPKRLCRGKFDGPSMVNLAPDIAKIWPFPIKKFPRSKISENGHSWIFQVDWAEFQVKIPKIAA